MSKKAKKASKEKNLQRKRARRLANKMRYQAMARAGENTRSKRFRSVNKRNRRAKAVKHLVSYCGNTGCKRCFPRIDKPRVFVKAKDLFKTAA